MTETQVRERPILFSAPMVRALLDGRKTQTRRIVRDQDRFDFIGSLGDDRNDPCNYGMRRDGNGDDEFLMLAKSPGQIYHLPCPHGKPGDRLWVRETWQTLTKYNDVAPNDLNDEAKHWINYPASGTVWDARMRSSIHCPRWASRITLEITSVRVERLQAISEADADKEGFASFHTTSELDGPSISARSHFAGYWDKLNGKSHPWSSNCWVWVISFSLAKRKESGE